MITAFCSRFHCDHPHQCCRWSGNIARVTLKINYFHYLERIEIGSYYPKKHFISSWKQKHWSPTHPSEKAIRRQGPRSVYEMVTGVNTPLCTANVCYITISYSEIYLYMITRVVVSANMSVRSPWKLLFYYRKVDIHRIKVSKNMLNMILKTKSLLMSTVFFSRYCWDHTHTQKVNI